jgi:hypothetical protein
MTAPLTDEDQNWQIQNSRPAGRIIDLPPISFIIITHFLGGGNGVKIALQLTIFFSA